MQNKPKDIPYCGVSKRKIRTADGFVVLNDANMHHLLEFIRERYFIHIRKDVKKFPPPYTSNATLEDYRFTNVRREHDRQTKHLIKNISTNPELTLEDKIINTFFFRAWNNWDTMRDFGGPWSATVAYDKQLKEVIRPKYHMLLKRNTGRKWWSSAYNQGGTKAAWKFPDGEGYERAYKEDKAKEFPDWEADIPLRVFHLGPWLKRGKIVSRILSADSQSETFEVIKEVRGFADFLAYQVFVDLTYIEEFPFSENEFVVAGPGCKKGLDYLFENYGGLTHEEALFWLRDNIQDYYDGYNYTYGNSLFQPDVWFSDLDYDDRVMNIMSLENCMCELSKYIRTVEGTGRPKVRYRPFEK